MIVGRQLAGSVSTQDTSLPKVAEAALAYKVRNQTDVILKQKCPTSLKQKCHTPEFVSSR